METIFKYIADKLRQTRLKRMKLCGIESTSRLWFVFCSVVMMTPQTMKIMISVNQNVCVFKQNRSAQSIWAHSISGTLTTFAKLTKQNDSL